MGRASFRDGGIFSQNHQAGAVTVTLTAGTDTAAVTFAKPMKNPPRVIPGINSNKAVTQVRAYSITNVGCTLAVVSAVTGTCVVSYIAFDDSYR